MSPPHARRASLAAVFAIALAGGCRNASTAVVLRVDTDVPRHRAMRLRAEVWRGVDRPARPGQRVWSTAVSGNTLGALPATFGVAPGEGGARDGVVTVLLEADVDAGGVTEPPLVIRRVGRFAFVPRQTLTQTVFLYAACGVRSAGCASVPAERCTPSVLCEERGLTCGAGGVCVAAELRPSLFAPRPVAPLGTSVVTTARPALRWALDAALDGARVELCRARECAAPEVAFDVRGAHGAPPVDLAAGVWFWRVRGRAGERSGEEASAAWWFEVPPRSAPRAASHGVALDLDGDARVELAVGAPGAGRVYVYPAAAVGADTGAPRPAPVVLLPPDDAARAGGAQFGHVVAAAGDVDGDGFAELIVTAPSAGAGRVYVYPGGRDGAGALGVSTPWTLDGAALGARAFGIAAAGAGDVDGDGYADVVVGASDSDQAWVLFGGPSGPRVEAAAALARTGAAVPEAFGAAVSGGGDVDGDGYADVVVGAYQADGLAGRAAWFRGGADRAAIGRAAAQVWRGVAGPAAQFGFASASAGDVDGDGFADVVTSAPDIDAGRGAVYVFSGGASGPRAVPDITLAGFGSASAVFGRALRTGDLDGDGIAEVIVGARADAEVGGVYAFRLGGAAADRTSPAAVVRNPDAAMGASFGFWMSEARDLDRDGRADLAVGAWRHPTDPPATGRVYLFRGAPGGLASAPALVFTGESDGAWFGYSLASL